MSKKPKNGQPWNSATATQQINRKARDEAFSVALKVHAEEQMADRNLIMSDVLHVLRNGFVYTEPQSAKTKGTYLYRVESTSPNSKGRTVAVVVIPSPTPAVVIVTVMWVDEKSHRGN